MKYYTYELIDPRNNIVFYVGKGTNKRMYSHFNSVKSGKSLRNIKLDNKLKKLVKENLKPIYKKVLETDVEKDAFNKEIELIKFYGQNNLCNMAPGGEGGFYSKEHALKFHKAGNDAFRKKVKTDKNLRQQLKKIAVENLKNAHKEGKIRYDTFAGKHHTSKTIEKMKKSHIGKHDGKNNSQFGTIWITNGKENRKIKKEEQVQKGWNRGRV